MSKHSLNKNASNQCQNAAVVRFADWLTDLTVQREVAYGVGGGAGKAKIVLCGHRYVTTSSYDLKRVRKHAKHVAWVVYLLPIPSLTSPARGLIHEHHSGLILSHVSHMTRL